MKVSFEMIPSLTQMDLILVMVLVYYVNLELFNLLSFQKNPKNLFFLKPLTAKKGKKYSYLLK